jgi:hypothetical protein
MHSFKTKAKILKNQNLLKDAIRDVEYFRKTRLLGFNSIAALLGVGSYHTLYIFMNRHMLSDINFERAKKHVIGSIIIGIGLGFFAGYWIAKDFGAYYAYRKVRNDLAGLNKNFEYYYILNKEQKFDD